MGRAEWESGQMEIVKIGLMNPNNYKATLSFIQATLK